MWSLCMLLLLNVAEASHWTLPEVSVICNEHTGPTEGFFTVETNPSVIDDLTVVPLMFTGQRCWTLNISWAIRIDKSIEYLTGTHLYIEFGSVLSIDCRYHPRLHNVSLRNDLQRAWFHHLRTDCRLKLDDKVEVDAYNLPKPPYTGTMVYYKSAECHIPDHLPGEQQSSSLSPGESLSTEVVSVMPPSEPSATEQRVDRWPSGPLLVTLGTVAGLLALVCFFLYQVGRKNPSYGFLPLPYTPQEAVSVLVIYPAENPAFQNAVVALAEFLLASGCSVDIDLWQLCLLAEMGPLRWLAQTANKADRVLVVCPPGNHDSVSCPPSSGLGHLASVPTAAASDLFPLVLNMVASQAVCPGQRDKFWVLHLGKAPESSELPVELRGCRKFCLMKDVEKLSRKLRRQPSATERLTSGRLTSGRLTSGRLTSGRLGVDEAHRRKANDKLSDAVRCLGTRQGVSQSHLVELKLTKENIYTVSM